MKEIGGYFQLEDLHGAEYHTDLLRFNLGRTALLFALQALHVKTLFLPRFICDSVTSVCEQSGITLKWYGITEDFLPDLNSFPDREVLPAKDTCVYLINYYGQLTDDRILSLKKVLGRILVDHTHSFFQRPLSGIPTLYSCRKFFGLPDGAYLYLPADPEISGNYAALPVDSSSDRMKHILGRYEHSASDYYSDMLSAAHSFFREPVKQMSPLTENLLRGIDYPSAIAKRRANYRTLEELLSSRNPLTPASENVPFVYPFYTKNAPEVKKALAARKVFVPTYWNNVLEQLPRETIEWDFASHILPLPVDQRYDTEDMSYLGNLLLSLL